MMGGLAAILGSADALVFAAAAVFARVGAVMFLVPGLGERGIPVRVRLMAAAVITAMLVPVVSPRAGPPPPTAAALVLVLLAEAAVGLVIGLAFRFLVFALQVAGIVAAQHLSVAQMFGAGVGLDPEPTIATLLAMGGIALALAAGLHVQLIGTLIRFYEAFPVGRAPPAADLADWAVGRFARTFALGVTLAAPFVAIGFVYNLALGALNRAMPQLLVALVGVPALVWIGMVVLALVLPAMMDTWLAHLGRTVADPLGAGQ